MTIGSECTSRNHLSCWTEGDRGSSNSSVMVYCKAFSLRLCKKKVQHNMSDLSIGLCWRPPQWFCSVERKRRTSNGLPRGARGTAEVFGTEPCCLNTYSPLPLRLLLCLSKQSVLPAVFSGRLQNIRGSWNTTASKHSDLFSDLGKFRFISW